MTVTENNIEVLKSRVLKGLVYCNDLWQKTRATEDESEFNKLFAQLDIQVNRLKELNRMLTLQGYSECVFEGPCKSNDEFLCFVCSKGV
jgi:hypothetical protein